MNSVTCITRTTPRGRRTHRAGNGLGKSRIATRRCQRLKSVWTTELSKTIYLHVYVGFMLKWWRGCHPPSPTLRNSSRCSEVVAPNLRHYVVRFCRAGDRGRHGLRHIRLPRHITRHTGVIVTDIFSDCCKRPRCRLREGVGKNSSPYTSPAGCSALAPPDSCPAPSRRKPRRPNPRRTGGLRRHRTS